MAGMCMGQVHNGIVVLDQGVPPCRRGHVSTPAYQPLQDSVVRSMLENAILCDFVAETGGFAPPEDG